MGFALSDIVLCFTSDILHQVDICKLHARKAYRHKLILTPTTAGSFGICGDAFSLGDGRIVKSLTSLPLKRIKV